MRHHSILWATLVGVITLTLVAIGSFSAGWYLHSNPFWLTNPILSPIAHQLDNATTPKPLQRYSILNLQQYAFQPSFITLGELLDETAEFQSFSFTYQTMGKTMSGQLNLPRQIATTNPPVVVMLRGYVPAEVYTTGTGTKNAAGALAKAGYITVAPDFFEYGTSDPDFTDTWEARFAKPIQVIELIKTIETSGIPTTASASASVIAASSSAVPSSTIGLWAHSNGGQIALTTLEILRRAIPTTLWAPVTAPFPYSVLYFSDELADEGKEQRAWVAIFEKTYDVFDFSLTQHLGQLTGPVQIHQGTNDDAVLKWWSDEFVDKITAENKRRQTENKALATQSAEIQAQAAPLPPVEIEYHLYPGANHNLQPGWDTVVQRDIEFFKKHLTTN
jgi:alpha-beta hydrolase superfamily lysophospholipase